MIFHIDMDEVLVCNYRSLLEMKGLPFVYDDPNNLGNYNVHELVGQTWEEYWLSITEDQWANLGIFPWSKSLIDMALGLEKNLTNFKFRFLTAPIYNSACLGGKVKWLEKHFPSLRSRIVIAGNKQDIVARGDLLLDDSRKNYEKFIAADKDKSFMMWPSLGNSLHPIIPKNLDEINKMVNDVKEKLISKYYE